MIQGWHRRFCLWMPAGRGTRDNPGLMLGLDRGGSCRGIVRALATAHGRLGRARDYLHNTVVHLDELGIGDGPMHRLLALVEAYDEDATG